MTGIFIPGIRANGCVGTCPVNAVLTLSRSLAHSTGGYFSGALRLCAKPAARPRLRVKKAGNNNQAGRENKSADHRITRQVKVSAAGVIVPPVLFSTMKFTLFAVANLMIVRMPVELGAMPSRL